MRPDPTDPWWPHPALDAVWLRPRLDDVDLVHLHFGYEHRSTEQMAEWLDLLDAAKCPLVLTVHDIDHPHLVDSSAHLRHLELLVPRAAAVITLTDGAADRLQALFGRRPHVVEHPPLIDEPVRRRGRIPGLVRLGVDLRRHRPSDLALDVICDLLHHIARTHYDIEVTALRSEDQAPLPRPVRTRLLGRGAPHDRYVDVLADWDVLLLPLRHITHSGRVEVCRDIGTAVVTTAAGHLLDQWSDGVVAVPTGHRQPGIDAVVTAIRNAAAREPRPSTSEDLVHRRSHVQRAHGDIYDSAVAHGRRPGVAVDAA